jgi:hypothetical protein
MWAKPLNGRQKFAFLFFEKYLKEISSSSTSHVIKPSSIVVEIRSINPSFRSYTQQVTCLNNSKKNFYFI